MEIHNNTLAGVAFAAITLAIPVFSFAQSAPTTQPSPPLNYRVVASFDPSYFAESVTLDREGNLYVSLSNFSDTCEVLKINPETRAQSVVASFPSVNTCETSFLLGVAFDERDRLHVIVSLQKPTATNHNGEPGPKPGVYRIEEDGSVSQVLSLPATSFPNGLAFYKGDMYVSDSNLGAIWKKGPHDDIDQTTPWYQDPVLQPPSQPAGAIGANGIAFLFDQLYVAVYDAGSVVRIPVRPDGRSPVHHEVLVTDPRLIGMDGIAFDVFGRLWFTVNYSGTNGTEPGGKLGFIDERRVHILADTPGPGWLNYPTMVAFGTTFRERGTIYLTNGGTQINVLAIRVGVGNWPLPTF